MPLGRCLKIQFQRSVILSLHVCISLNFEARLFYDSLCITSLTIEIFCYIVKNVLRLINR